MPIDRQRNDGTVFRKFLNAKRPRSTGGGPATFPLQVFNGFTNSTIVIPPTGNALTQRTAWETFIVPGTEILTFESLANGTQLLATNIPLNGINLSIANPDFLGMPLYDPAIDFIVRATDDIPNGRYNTTSGGSHFWNQMKTQATDAVSAQTVILFDMPISQFGTYMTDVGEIPAGQWTLRLTRSDLVQFTYVLFDANVLPGPAASGSLNFWGFVDGQETYTKIELFCPTDGADVFGFDDMSWGGYTTIQNP